VQAGSEPCDIRTSELPPSSYPRHNATMYIIFDTVACRGLCNYPVTAKWVKLPSRKPGDLGPDLSPRNFAARTRRRVRVLVSTPALTPSLIVSRRKAWPGVIGLRRHLRIGVGAPGGARASGSTGRSGRLSPGALSQQDVLGGDPQHGGECHTRISPVSDQPPGPLPPSPPGSVKVNNPPKSNNRYMRVQRVIPGPVLRRPLHRP